MRQAADGTRPPAAAYVAVIGPGAGATPQDVGAAWQVGCLLAERGAIVVCGGLGGVMAAAAEGAVSRGGLAVGLLPGRDRGAGNPFLSVALPTGLGELRNGLVVGVSDAVIAIGGSWGTLSELALAMRTGKPVVVMGGWSVHDPEPGGGTEQPERAASAEQAVEQALTLAAQARPR